LCGGFLLCQVRIQETNPPVRLLAKFTQLFPKTAPAYLFQAGGREMWVAGILSNNDEYTLYSPDNNDGKAIFTWRSARQKRSVTNRPLPSWARYSAGVVVTLANAGLTLQGVQVVIVGEQAVGPRYDYDMGMALAALCYTIQEYPFRQEHLHELMEQVRREYMNS